MAHGLALARRGRLGRRLRSITFWMSQAPVFLVAFATLGLAVRGEWVAFAALVTCVWIYARILGHRAVMAQVDRAFTAAVLAVAARLPKRPTVVEAPAPAVADEPAAPIAEAAPAPPTPFVEPTPPKRAPRRVRPVEASPAKRLLLLEELRETGLVTAAEYQDKRQEILRAI